MEGGNMAPDYIFTEEDVQGWIPEWLSCIIRQNQVTLSQKVSFIKCSLGVNMIEGELGRSPNDAVDLAITRLIRVCPLCRGGNEKCKLCKGVGGLDSVRVENILQNRCPHYLFCIDSTVDCYRSEVSECEAQPTNEPESVLYFNFLSMLRENKRIDLSDDKDKTLSFILNLHKSSGGNSEAITFIKETAEIGYRVENSRNNGKVHKPRPTRMFEKQTALHA
jgi:hypothetical protein